MSIAVDALLIFGLRVLGITVSTLTTILTVQGRKFPAILTGSLSSFLYVVAIGKVVTNLDNALNIVAYVAGFGTGTWVGMFLEQRMALGYAQVRIISTSQGDEVAGALREAGFGVTEMLGRGRENSVAVVEALVPRRRVTDVLRVTEDIDSHAIVAVSEARSVERGYWQKPDRRR
jgi:uncharacterized protein YebE (UPF0316 family)